VTIATLSSSLMRPSPSSVVRFLYPELSPADVFPFITRELSVTEVYGNAQLCVKAQKC